jgi:LPXTG-site transpeptidase (sortase) family protein
MTRVGTALILLGLAAVVYGGLWQLGLAPGSRVTLPPPVALESRPTAAPLAVPVALEPAAPTPTPPVVPTAVREVRPTVAPPPTVAPIRLAASDAADRQDAASAPRPGYAVRLAIPAIKLEADVKQGGIVQDAAGNPIWQTMPFVAVHYGDLTSLIGARGNAVIAGHVVTLNEGNVFRFLYQLDIDDQIQVWDDNQDEFDYHVVQVKLVPPSDVSVMAPTPDERLTLITCGGTFDPVKREFSDRLIVVAKPN